MLIKRPDPILPSEITPQAIHQRRRDFIKVAGLGTLAALSSGLPSLSARAQPSSGFPGLVRSPLGATDEKPTPLRDITHYNNFYEFGYDKESPATLAGALKVRPWAIVVDGLVAKPRTFSIDELLRLAPLEERIYRMRCVEGWSMVIPWVGFPLAALLKQVEPLGSARFVAFQTRLDRETMPGTRLPYLNWPYAEGLRLDEARHPLTLLAVGLYGDILPNQNGAPLRLVVPWKYGFKGAKSLVRITLTERQPVTAWNQIQGGEYGFYANVNPMVDHPRWSQAKERRIGEFLRRPTLMFNGYGDQVGQLYAGMDLRKYY